MKSRGNFIFHWLVV